MKMAFHRYLSLLSLLRECLCLESPVKFTTKTKGMMCGTATAKLRHARSRRHDHRFVEDYTSEWIYCEQIIKETS